MPAEKKMVEVNQSVVFCVRDNVTVDKMAHEGSTTRSRPDMPA